MAYSNNWSVATPTGTEAANTIDNIIRSTKLDLQERLVDIWAMPNFTDDPLRPYGIKFTDIQNAVISLGDNAGTPRTLLIKDKAGANTYYTFAAGAFTVDGGSLNVNATGANAQFNLTRVGQTTWRLLSDAAGAFSISDTTLATTVTALTIAPDTGIVIFVAGSTAGSSIRLPHGAAPTSPVNGDIWTTTAGIFVRINGATVGPLS